MKKIKVIGYLLVIYILCNSCAKNPVTGHNDFMLMSKGQEIALGQQSDPEIKSFFGVYPSELLQKFINEEGQRMVGVSHRQDLKYEFKIVDSPVVNAFAVPGGYVYFTRGIMAHLNNEAEFAGVLGHEIGHITARHSAKQYSQAQLAQIGLLAGSVISPTFAQMAQYAQQGVQLLFLKFGREAESQADKLGVEYSTKIGFDSREMAKFFSTLGRLSALQGAEKIPTFLSTHPDPADREQKVEKQAEVWEKKTDIATLKVNRDKYLHMIDGIVYGEDPKQGFVENNMFYHPDLKFQFPIPSQWTVENSPQQVQMGAKDGSAVMMFGLAEGNQLEAAGQALLQQYQLRLLDSKRVNVNGLPAFTMVADQQQQQQEQGVRTLIYLIQYGENIYTMIGATSVANFNSYVPLFETSMGGFNVLTDPDKLSRKPERVKIKTIPQNTTLGQAFTSFGVKQNRMEEFAVLNGMMLNDRVEKGMLIKIVE